MKYAGPLGVTSRDLRELFDYCNSEDRKPSKILFYYWGQTGNYMLAVRETALADQNRFPNSFRDLDWRDTPYPSQNKTLDQIVGELPADEQAKIAARTQELIAETRAPMRDSVVPEEFIEQVTVIPCAEAVTEPFGPIDPAGGTTEPEPIGVTDLETPGQ